MTTVVAVSKLAPYLQPVYTAWEAGLRGGKVTISAAFALLLQAVRVVSQAAAKAGLTGPDKQALIKTDVAVVIDLLWPKLPGSALLSAASHIPFLAGMDPKAELTLVVDALVLHIEEEVEAALAAVAAELANAPTPVPPPAAPAT